MNQENVDFRPTAVDGISVLVAQRHRLFRGGLKAILELTPGICVTAQAAHTQQLMDEVKRFHPGVVVLDTLLPKTTPKPLRDLVPEIASLSSVVLLLTLPKGGIYKRHTVGGYRSALGLVLKDNPGDELIKAVQTAAMGVEYVSPSIVTGSSRGIGVINKLTNSDVLYGNLTDREIELLRLLAIGMINKKVAQALGISVKTVETHRNNILDKLGLQRHDHGGVIAYALLFGLIEPDEIGVYPEDLR